mgnify:CR=1 FL=1
MPRKCCMFWDGKSCRTNFQATKKHSYEGGTVYRFPDDIEEQKRWELALSNKLNSKHDDGRLKKHIIICYKRFPNNVR